METLMKVVIPGIGILLTIIGFFVAYFFRRSIESNDKLNESVNKLQITITGMSAVVQANKDNVDTYKREHEKSHEIVDRRLNSHSVKLNEHDKEITKLKSKTLGT